MIQRKVFYKPRNVSGERAISAEERVHHREEHHHERAFEQSRKQCTNERAEKCIDQPGEDEKYERQNWGLRRDGQPENTVVNGRDDGGEGPATAPVRYRVSRVPSITASG